MVGIGSKGMDVRNLNDREQRQQDETNHRGHRERSRRAATAIMPFFVKSCQKHFPRI